MYLYENRTAPVENERQDTESRKDRRQTAAYVADVRQDFPLAFINIVHLNLLREKEGKHFIKIISAQHDFCSGSALTRSTAKAVM